MNSTHFLFSAGRRIVPTSRRAAAAAATNAQQHLLSTCRRDISSRAARDLLGLPARHPQATHHPISLRELRHAYFAAAKKCHPDIQKNHSEEEKIDYDFLQVTQAYEVLHREITQNIVVVEDDDDLITETEEEEFRRACQSWLGIKAEIVEECKQNPIFRRWLTGNTDAAHHWRMFFVQNGGLAPKLRAAGNQLTAGKTYKPPPHTTRRKKR